MAISEFSSLNKPVGQYFDWTTFLISVLLIAIGLISVYSATYIYSSSIESGMSPIFVKQVIAAIVGIIIMGVLIYIPEPWLYLASYPLYLLSILLLILVLIIGTETAGTKGWINFGGFSIQPAEIAKLTTILAIARYLSERGKDIRSIRDLGIVSAICVLPVILIMFQPDFGSASVILAIFLGILLWTGYDLFTLYFVVCLPVIIILSLAGTGFMVFSLALFSSISFFFRKSFATVFIAIGVFMAVGLISPVIYNKLQQHQKDRINTFLNPGSDPRGKGYNVIQSKLAVGSGGMTGKGFLKGTQTQLRYIPKQWTDFIFSVPTEEFGFLGGVTVVSLLFSFIWRSVRIAKDSNSKFSSIIAFGIAIFLLYHTLINIGMAIGLMPVMGIPLPFLSAGGTSLLVNIIMAGLLLNIYRTWRIKRQA